ncbi:MAG: LysR family transcriptional regulator, partial [Sphingopyxis terrae]|nr:LysR family transcriptional regulator [Sphingopyxis terrae]
MDRFEAMRTLVAAIDGGSLSAASRALGIPLATVSRRGSGLEARLGPRPGVRPSRQTVPTEEGAAFLAGGRRGLGGIGGGGGGGPGGVGGGRRAGGSGPRHIFVQDMEDARRRAGADLDGADVEGLGRVLHGLARHRPASDDRAAGLVADRVD